MSEQNLELGEIDCDVVEVNRISIFVASAGENRCAGVKHNRDSIGLRRPIDDFQFLKSIQVVIWK